MTSFSMLASGAMEMEEACREREERKGKGEAFCKMSLYNARDEPLNNFLHSCHGCVNKNHRSLKLNLILSNFGLNPETTQITWMRGKFTHSLIYWFNERNDRNIFKYGRLHFYLGSHKRRCLFQMSIHCAFQIFLINKQLFQYFINAQLNPTIFSAERKKSISNKLCNIQIRPNGPLVSATHSIQFNSLSLWWNKLIVAVLCGDIVYTVADDLIESTDDR